MSRESTAVEVERRPSAASGPSADDDPSTAMNAVVGAVLTVLAAPLLPFAAIAGGALAGYLQRGDPAAGAKVGALSGAIAAVPAALFAWFVLSILLLGGADPFFAFTGLFALGLFAVVACYLVGAGALGGALGAYVREEL